MRIRNLAFISVITLFICFSAMSVHSQTQSHYLITGLVRDAANQPMPGMRVCAFPPNARPEQSTSCRSTDEGGKFSIPLKVTGTYTLIPDKSHDGYYSQRLLYFKDPSIKLTKVVLDEDNKSAFVTLYLGPKNAMLVGKSVDENTNLPIESVYFLLYHVDNPQACWGTSAKNSSGEFRVPAAHVPFTLKASAEGYEDWIGLSGADQAGTPISVAPGSIIQLSIRMRRKPGAATRPLNEAEKQEGINLPAPKQLSPADGMKYEQTPFPRDTKLNRNLQHWDTMRPSSFQQQAIRQPPHLLLACSKCSIADTATGRFF